MCSLRCHSSIKLELGYLANKGRFPDRWRSGQALRPVAAFHAGAIWLHAWVHHTRPMPLLNQVPNPFNGVIGPGTTYSVASSSLTSSATIEQAALLKHWPQYSSVSSFRKPGSASMYNAFTLRADKQLTHGLTFTFSLTDGREYDNAASSVNYLGNASQTYADQYNPKSGVGHWRAKHFLPDRFEFPLSASARPWTDVPQPRWHRGEDRRRMGSERYRNLVHRHAGLSKFCKQRNHYADRSEPIQQRPAWTGQTAKLQSPTYKQWFNPNVFSMPASFAIGNAPRTLWDVNNPSFQNLDLAILKNTKWGSSEHYNVQFRLEMFNAFNHPSLGSPNNSLTSGQFGVISGFNGTARRIQLAGKVYF